MQKKKQFKSKVCYLSQKLKKHSTELKVQFPLKRCMWIGEQIAPHAAVWTFFRASVHTSPYVGCIM